MRIKGFTTIGNEVDTIICFNENPLDLPTQDLLKLRFKFKSRRLRPFEDAFHLFETIAELMA